MPPSDPSLTFFGVSAGSDPFLLLGLPRTKADESAVLSALGIRMAEIARHVRSHTPEANELRLALHAAAAQLLDPQLQQLLLEQSSAKPPSKAESVETSDPAPASPHVPGAVEHTASRSVSVASSLTHDLLRVVASHGGWNQHALRQLVMLAHARGVPSSELPTLVSRVLSTPLIGALPAETGTESATQERHGQPRSGRIGATPNSSSVARNYPTKIGNWVVPAVFAILTVSSLLIVWVRLTAEPTRDGVEAGAADTSTPAATQRVTQEAPDSIADAPPAPSMTLEESTSLLRDIASQHVLTQESQSDAIGALQTIAESWNQLDADEVAAVHNHLVDLFYASTSDSTFPLRLVEAIAKPGTQAPRTSQELIGTVWAAGTLSRLSAERNLSTTVDASIVGRLSELMGDGFRTRSPGFNEGAAAALSSSARELSRASTDVNTWHTWLGILRKVHAPDSPEHDALVIGAIEELATLGAEPNQNRSVFESLHLLASELRLEEKNPAARALVGWLSDDRVSVADLSVIMRPLIGSASVDGVTESLIISAAADPSRRMTIRAELEAHLLGIDAQASEAIEAWARIAEQEIARNEGTSAVELLVRAAARSRLSSAARDIFWGRYEEAQKTLGNLTADLDRLANSLGDDPNAYLGGDGALDWAERYLSARQNIPVRQALLAELTRGRHRLGSVAAEALVRDAVFGTPATIRAQAQEVTRLYADSPAVANAFLEILPRMPKVESTVQLIETVTSTYLPSPSDPDWDHLARQALVETLLIRTSGVGEGEIIDQLSIRLSESYRDRLPGQRASGSTPEPSDLINHAHDLAQHWARSATSGSTSLDVQSRLESIQMKRVGRMTLAEGLITRFAAEQVSLVETMAVAIASERPNAASEIESIMQTLSKRRRSAGDVLQQISAVEEAAVQLWHIRLGGER